VACADALAFPRKPAVWGLFCYPLIAARAARHSATSRVTSPPPTFGGSTATLYVGVHRHALHQTLDLDCDGCVAHPNLKAAASGTALLINDGQRDSVAEVQNLLHLGLEVVMSTAALAPSLLPGSER
jgi:hypothetical protein